MSERAAFIRSICEEPEDDVRRLAFADWLDENGEGERAEFIRVQCELAKLPSEPRELFVADGAGKRLERFGVALTPRGGGHYSASNAERGLSIETFAPDERVDIYVHFARADRVGWVRGLKYVRTHEDRNEIIFRKDAGSGPWAGAAMLTRERELLAGGGDGRYQSNAFRWAEPLSSSGALLGRLWPEVMTYTRGFVSRVELTCAQFFANGFAGNLFVAQPVTEVALPDYVFCPQWLDGRWILRVNNVPYLRTVPELTATYLPVAFRRLLKGGCDYILNYGDRQYDTEWEARAALYDACIAYGRELAGLVAIPELAQ